VLRRSCVEGDSVDDFDDPDDFCCSHFNPLSVYECSGEVGHDNERSGH
jgi:hypothetical protein